jgi:hypothetical protein
MSRIVFTTTANGWITSNSKEHGTVMGRTSVCNGCGYQQKTILPARYDRKLWEENHTLESCRSRKAFNNLLGNPLEKLAALSIREF